MKKNLYKKNIVTKFYFFIYYVIKFIKILKYNYNIIFNIRINYSKSKFVCSLPRSGSHYLNFILNSYLQLINKTGDGIPKIIKSNINYEIINTIPDSRGSSPINPIFEINKYPTFLFPKRLGVLNKKKVNFDYTIINYSHYPLNNLNLLDKKKFRSIILIRNPLDAAISYILLLINHRLGNKKITTKFINNNKEFILESIDQVIIFFTYWNSKYNDKKRFSFVKYEELISNTSSEIKKILKFFKIPINMRYIKLSIKLNSLKYLKKKGFKNYIIITQEKDRQLKKVIKKIIINKIRNNSQIFKNFYKI